MPRVLPLVVAAAAACFLITTTAFVVQQRPVVPIRTASSRWALAMDNQEGNAESSSQESHKETVQPEQPTEVEREEEQTSQVQAEEEQPTEGKAEEEQTEVKAEELTEEDKEVKALKEEIARLESTLKEKRRLAALTSDQAEEYSKAGYARKVAEMETMRRMRSMLQSSNTYTATADIVREFLPSLDRLDHLRETYGDDEFGKQYNALPGAMRTALAELGVTEYAVAVGEPFDPSRMALVEERYSESVAPDFVLEQLRMGMELKGNIVRMAECVVSLGPEQQVEEETQEEVTLEEAPPAQEEEEEEEEKSDEKQE